VRSAIRAGTNGIAYFAVTTIGLLVTLELANRVQGGVVAYRVAFAFFELPKALIGLPIAVAILPALSERFHRGDDSGFASLVSNGWRAAMFAAAPASIGLFVLAPQLSQAMLGSAPTGAAPALVSACLRGLALGIPAYALVEPIARSFYARRDTRSPVLWNAAGVVVFAAVVVPATVVMQARGGRALELVGVATSAGQWVAVVVGIAMLAAVVPRWTVGADVASAAGSLARAVVMGAAVWIVAHALDGHPVLACVGGLGAGVASYVLLTARSGELRRTVALLREARV
jgi:putative peptidoglycan lipid II flippase